MSSTTIESLIDEVQAAFDQRPTDLEDGLDVDDAALLQLRKACRLLAGAEVLLEVGYDTLVIEVLKNASVFGITEIYDFRRRHSSRSSARSSSDCSNAGR